MKQQKSRWVYIDLMECIAIFMVIFYHATTYRYEWTQSGSTLHYLRYFLRTFLSPCVPLFFFANGYLLLNRSFSLKKHLIKTLKMIVLTIVWAAIYIVALMLIQNDLLSRREFIENLFFWKQGSQTNFLWYMGALVCIYIAFPLIKVAFDNKRSVVVFFMIACAIFTFGNTLIGYSVTTGLNLLGRWDGIIYHNWFSIFNLFQGVYGYAFVYFCAGGFAHGFIEKIKKVPARKRNTLAAITILISCTGLFLTGIALSRFSGQIWDVVWGGNDTIFTLINVCMIFVLCLSYQKNQRLIKLISVNTMGIYFIHKMVIHLTKGLVLKIPFADSFPGCAVYALLILGVCLGITQLLLKIPVLKKLVAL